MNEEIENEKKRGDDCEITRQDIAFLFWKKDGFWKIKVMRCRTGRDLFFFLKKICRKSCAPK